MLQVTTVFNGLPGLPGYNTLYFEGSGSFDAESAHSAVEGMWAQIALSLSTSLEITVENEVLDVSSADGSVSQIFVIANTPINGGLVGDALPLATQLLINFSTPGLVNNRRVRGRMFIPGNLEQTNDPNGAPSATYAADILNLVNTGFTNASSPQVIWSRPVPGGRAGSQHVVGGRSVKSQWAVLTSRRP